jgi:hypothetical protein
VPEPGRKKSVATAAPPASVTLPPAIAPGEKAQTVSLQIPMGMIAHLSLSPDGKRVAYIDRGNLWIAGTDGATPVIYEGAVGTPFWSPDGSSVAATDGKKRCGDSMWRRANRRQSAQSIRLFRARGVRTGPF